LKEIPSNVKSLKLHSEIEDIDLLYLPSTIEILDIRNCTKLTDSCLSYLPDNLKNLNLFGLKNIKLESFTKLKNLNILFNYTRIDNYVTPLYLYCSKGKLEEVKNILNKIQYPDINKSNNDGWTPLHISCLNGHLEIVKFLIEKWY
jgi:ankyrin repeat protein